MTLCACELLQLLFARSAFMSCALSPHLESVHGKRRKLFIILLPTLRRCMHEEWKIIYPRGTEWHLIFQWKAVMCLCGALASALIDISDILCETLSPLNFWLRSTCAHTAVCYVLELMMRKVIPLFTKVFDNKELIDEGHLRLWLFKYWFDSILCFSHVCVHFIFASPFFLCLPVLGLLLKWKKWQSIMLWASVKRANWITVNSFHYFVIIQPWELLPQIF